MRSQGRNRESGSFTRSCQAELRTQVFASDPCDDNGPLHRVASKRLAEFLIENNLDKSSDSFLLVLAGLLHRFGHFGLRPGDDAVEAASLRDLGVAQMWIKFGADKVVVIPKDRIALFGAPLVVAENGHGDSRPLLASDRAHFVHRNAEGAVS